MASEISPIQRLERSAAQMDGWIAANRPTPSRSQEVFTAFMERYGSQITGSEGFIAKTQRVIEKASKLAAGAVAMQRLLDAGRPLTFKEGGTSSFVQPDTIELNFSGPNTNRHVCFNEKGERIYDRPPRVSTWIHESLHAWHFFAHPEEDKARSREEGFLPEMDSAEEELTITGNLHIDNPACSDFCCENTALRELGRPLRINHRGTESSEEPDLHECVRHRITPNILQLSESGLVHNEKKEGLTPLELAMHLYLLDSRPETQSEWIPLMHLLVRSGCHSEYALRLAVLLNAKDLLLPLLQAGAKLTDKMLSEAIEEPSKRFNITWKLLMEQNWVVSNETIEKLLELPYEIPPGTDPQDLPPYKMMTKQNKQYAAIQVKFDDDGTLPIHTLEQLFYFQPLDHKQAFVDWVQAHSYRKVRKQERAQENSAPPGEIEENGFNGGLCAAFHEPENLNFEFNPDGLLVPSETYQQYTHLIPVCYRRKTYLFSSEPCHPFFTRTEVETFAKSFTAEHTRRLASTLSSYLMKSLHLDYAADWELEGLLTEALNTEISTALASPKGLIEKLEYSTPTHYVDIAILSEHAEGLLAQATAKLNGRYAGLISRLEDKEAKPVSSISCHLKITEHLIHWEKIDENSADTTCRLHIACQILVNGSPFENTTYGF